MINLNSLPIYIVAGAVSVGALVGTGYYYGRQHTKDRYEVQIAAEKQIHADAVAALTKDMQSKLNSARDTYQKELENVEIKAKTVVADSVASGNKLYVDVKRPTVCSSAESDAGQQSYERAELRTETAESLVSIGLEADAQVKGLQDAVRALTDSTTQ